MKKKISALMTVYNGEKFIEEAINSILKQTYSNFELIIVEDGSIDNTISVIEKFEDSRIKLVRLPQNIGVGGAISIGLQHATGEYIAKVDADDVYNHNRFELQINYLEGNPDVTMVGSLIEYFPDDEKVKDSQSFYYAKNHHEVQVNTIITPDDIKEKLYWFPCIIHSTVMFRKKILESISYNPTLKISEDYDFFYKLNDAGYLIHKLPLKLAMIRISDSSTTVREKANNYDVLINIKSKYLLTVKNREIFVWGTGEIGKSIALLLENKGLTISGFIDNNLAKVGEVINGIKVYEKTVLKYSPFVIIASTLGKFEIVKELTPYNYKHLDDYIVML